MSKVLVVLMSAAVVIAFFRYTLKVEGTISEKLAYLGNALRGKKISSYTGTRRLTVPTRA